MSTIPKGSTDNYSKHVKKIDEKGNLKSHPRTKKASTYSLSNLKRVGESMVGEAKKYGRKYNKAKVAIGEVIEKGRKMVDYDPEDRTKAKKRW